VTTPPRDGLAPDFLSDLFRHPLDPGYADAAARRAEHGPRPPWRRRGAYGLKVLTLVAIGFLLAVAYRQAVKAEPEATRAHAGLVGEVKSAQTATDDLQNQSDQLRRQVSDAQAAALGADAAELRQLRQEEAATGLAPVTGPGAVVRLVDAPTPIDPNTGRQSDQPVNRVLDIDLQGVANALWVSGAEAIAINGQRLIATSTIRAAGNAILVDLAPLSEPYTIQAIGPSSMTDALRKSAVGGFYSYLATSYGVKFAVRSTNGLRLAGAADPGLRYATPITPITPSSPPSPSGPVPSGTRPPGAGSTGSSPPASNSPPATPSPGGP